MCENTNAVWINGVLRVKTTVVYKRPPSKSNLEVGDITRLVLSRIVPQLYDPLGGHIVVLKAQGKLLLSRSPQLVECL